MGPVVVVSNGHVVCRKSNEVDAVPAGQASGLVLGGRRASTVCTIVRALPRSFLAPCVRGSGAQRGTWLAGC